MWRPRPPVVPLVLGSAPSAAYRRPAEGAGRCILPRVDTSSARRDGGALLGRQFLRLPCVPRRLVAYLAVDSRGRVVSPDGQHLMSTACESRLRARRGGRVCSTPPYPSLAYRLREPIDALVGDLAVPSRRLASARCHTVVMPLRQPSVPHTADGVKRARWGRDVRGPDEGPGCLFGPTPHLAAGPGHASSQPGRQAVFLVCVSLSK